jgi:hypothetical protein
MKRVAVAATTLALLAAGPAAAQTTGPTFPTDGPPVPSQSTQITIKFKKKKKKKGHAATKRQRAVLRAISRVW